MQPEYFWNSTDGQILSVKTKGPDTLALVLAFWPRNPAEFEFIHARLNEIHFTERSTLARIGIEMITPGVPRLDRNRFILETDAFLFDPDGPLDLTSLDAIEIAIAVEREYKVKMKNMSSARDYFKSVATLADFIAKNADPAGLERFQGASK